MERTIEDWLGDEQSLVDGIRNQSDAAYRSLAHTLETHFLPSITRKMRSKEDARAILNRTAMRIISRIDTYKPRAGQSFWGWVWRITENLVRDEYRRRQRTERIKSVSLETLGELGLAIEEFSPRLFDEEPEETTETPFARAAREAIGKLSQRDRDILELFYLADVSDKEVAKRIGTREDNVRKYRSRAVMRLRAIIQDYPEFREWQQKNANTLQTTK